MKLFLQLLRIYFAQSKRYVNAWVLASQAENEGTYQREYQLEQVELCSAIRRGCFVPSLAEQTLWYVINPALIERGQKSPALGTPLKYCTWLCGGMNQLSAATGHRQR